MNASKKKNSILYFKRQIILLPHGIEDNKLSSILWLPTKHGPYFYQRDFNIF